MINLIIPSATNSFSRTSFYIFSYFSHDRFDINIHVAMYVLRNVGFLKKLAMETEYCIELHNRSILRNAPEDGLIHNETRDEARLYL